MLSLQNPGLIPITAITTMGVNAKLNSDSIGFFGTGLKYAIAVILRYGGNITIWRGAEERLDFYAEPELVNDKQFHIVHMRRGGRDLPLGFTTELGKHWQPGMAFRELWSNMLDENGSGQAFPHEPIPEHTTIHITNCLPIDEAFAERKVWFLESQPLFVLPGLFEVHANSSGSIYYRGIKAGSLPKPSCYTYNILAKQTLTEDRTLKELFYSACQLNHDLKFNPSIPTYILERVLNCTDANWEYSFDWDIYSSEPSNIWKETAELALRHNFGRCNRSIMPVLSKWKTGIGKYVPLAPNKIESIQLARSISVLERIGYPEVGSKFPINICEDLGEGVLGQAHRGEIWLTRKAFGLGTKVVAGTLLEEFLHLDIQVLDETRPFQNYLIDKIMSMAEEHVLGEPL